MPPSKVSTATNANCRAREPTLSGGHPRDGPATPQQAVRCQNACPCGQPPGLARHRPECHGLVFRKPPPQGIQHFR
eukprot:12942672-Alexandrium_andersonii.AAC.1